MEPGSEEPGNRADPAQVAREIQASMEPGSEEPGNRALSIVKHYDYPRASMEPGSEEPGNP